MKRLRPMLLVCVIDVLGFGVLIPLVPYMADRFGAPPALITPILGVYSLCQLLAAPFWGRLSDRFGRRPILMTSLAGACLSYVILGLAHSLTALVISRVLAGFMAGNLAAAFAYAADVSAPEERAKALGMVGASIGVGFMLGPAIGGLLAGDHIETASFTAPAALSACLSLLAVALVYWRLPESHDPKTVPSDAPARSRWAFGLLRTRPALRLLTAAALLVTFSQSTLESIFAIWAWTRFGFGPRTVGLLLFCLALVAISMQAGFVRRLVPRYGEVRVGATGVLCFVAGLCVTALGGNLAVTLAGLALCGMGAGAFAPSASALASKQATTHDRGAVMGTYQASTSLARIIGPLLAGLVFASLGRDAPFLIGAGVTLPAAWLLRRVPSVRAASEAHLSLKD